MKSIKEIQNEHKEWAYYNFGNQPTWFTILGMQEELGELAHHFLKREQNIRLDQDHEAGIKDAIGDFLIYLSHFCNNENLDIQEILNEVWEQVKKRDWRNNPKNGITE